MKSYTDTFDLDRYIRYNTKVLQITYADDHEVTGRWKVTVEKNDTKEQSTEVYDGVMVCTGHHTTPLIATFPGQDKFRGQITHSHVYKTSKGYEDKNVVIVGVGNSGLDTAVELASVAKQVYLVSRRGVWLVRRVGANGQPFDRVMSTRLYDWLQTYIPKRVVNAAAVYDCNKWFDHELYGLKPDHGVFAQHITLNDALPNTILSGRVKVTKGIKEFTEDGIIFEGSGEEIRVDKVILATGYQLTIPFIDPSIISFDNNNSNDVYLFKNMFNPNLKHHVNTLALIGLVQPYGPIFPISELQARWFTGLLTGHLELPSKEEMKSTVEEDRQFVADNFVASPRHNLEVYYMPYMDQLAKYVQVRPSLMKYALTDPWLAFRMVFGLFTSYQYRLEGRHPWPGARDAILSVDERISRPFQKL